MFSIPWNLNLEKAARNLDSQHIPNTWEARAWSEHIWLSKIEMDKMHTAFALPLMKQKHCQPRWKGCMSKTRNTTKAGHFIINRRTWWFVFHPCMIRETHHMASVSSSCSKGHIFLFSQMHLYPSLYKSSTPTSSPPVSSTVLIDMIIDFTK